MDDSQRKLHRILYNYYSSHREMPTWNVLIRSTGKSKEQLQRVLDEMQSVHILQWLGADPASITLLQMPGQTTRQVEDGQRYFTDY